MGIVDIIKAVRGGVPKASKPELRVVYALEPLRQSIFLAGPTPRSPEVASWRPEAIRKLAEMGFLGEVYVPESADWKSHTSYDAQVHWEWEALKQASVIVFWVPREIDTMPAFTTNVEFGDWVKSGKVIFGAPVDAPKMNYLRMLGKKYNVPCFSTLDETLQAAVEQNLVTAHETTNRIAEKVFGSVQGSTRTKVLLGTEDTETMELASKLGGKSLRTNISG
jgi:hypothetical protein